MKWSLRLAGVLVVFCASSLLVIRGQAQGAVYLFNHVAGLVDAPVSDLSGTNGVMGTYQALVVFGPAPGEWEASFSAGFTSPGYFAAQYVPELPFAKPGETVFAQVQVFSWNEYSYEGAIAAGHVVGESEVFTVKLGPRTDPALLIGLKPFALHYPAFATVNFQNLIPGVLDAPVLDVDGSRLSGSNFVAQIYARIATNQLSDSIPLGTPAPFGTGAGAGYWQPGTNSTLVLTNMGAGQIAQLQVYVWDSAKGATYNEASHTSDKRGQSVLLTVTTGGAGTPPSVPPVLSGLATFQVGGPAPGTLLFKNRAPGLVDQPVKDYLGNLLQKPLVVQLWANGVPVSDPAPFGTGADAGYWQPPTDGIVTLTNVQAGEGVLAELKIWDGAQAATYAQAQQGATRGTLISARIRTGGAGTPPGSPGLVDQLARYPVLLGGGVHAVYLNFNNFIPGEVDEPVIGSDGTRLSGPGYFAQLYAKPDDRPEFTPAGAPAPFGTGAQAGYWQPGPDAVSQVDVFAGCCASFQVLVWDTSKGSSYEEAGVGNRAKSRIVSFFGGQTGTLQGIGPISLVRRFSPILLLSSGSHLPSFLDVDFETLLSGPGYEAQLFVAKGAYAATNYFPVGTPAPLGSGAQSGLWKIPSDVTIDLTDFAPGDAGSAVLKVWETAKGATYDEASTNNSLLGESSQPAIFIANELDAPPSLVDFSYESVYLKGRIKKVSAPPGLSLLGNPYARGLFPFLGNVLNSPPDGTMVYEFNPETQSYAVASAVGGFWNSFYFVIENGAGFFVFNPTAAPLELVFQGVQGTLAVTSPAPKQASFQCISCTREAPTGVADLLGFPSLNGDTVFRFANGQWSTSQFFDGQWSAFDPILQPGEAVFIRLVARP